MSRTWRFFGLLLIMAPLLSSCWSRTELTDLAIVSAIGIDKTEDGQYTITLQIINPGNVAGGLQGGGAENPPVSIYGASGANLVEASRRASSRVSRKLYYAHTNLIVMGEKMVREEGITEIIDAIDRDPQFRITATMIIANGTTASNFVKTLTPIDKIPANKVIKTLEFTQERWGQHVRTNLQEVMQGLTSPGKQAVLSGFRLIGSAEQAKKLENIKETFPKARLQAGGLAIFKNGKLIDWLYGSEARGTVWILDRIQGTDINIDWKGKKEAIAYQIIRQRTKVSSVTKNGKPAISILARAEGDLGELHVPLDITNPKVIANIEKDLEKKIKEEMDAAIKQAKKNKVDSLGFGEVIHRSHPEKWKEWQAEWSDVYLPELDVNIKVDAYVRRAGLRNKSFLTDVKQN
ncbi:Ger(x)C family spore germination protein [Priestia megaterium]|nr:Ger(x)C family spore germination protein [Priestia megaterium]